jgi:hypothetical protein
MVAQLAWAATVALAAFGLLEAIFQILGWQRRRQARRYAREVLDEMQRERARLEAAAVVSFEQRRAR